MSYRVIGVDPGSTATGWALVVADGNRYGLEACGVLRPKGSDRTQRLAQLFELFVLKLDELQPHSAAVESTFAGRNPRSGLALAESRGVLLAGLGRAGIPVKAYSPAEVKSAVVGHGRAEKDQIIYMVVRLLRLAKAPPQDAADAAAVAITHLHTAAWKRRRESS